MDRAACVCFYVRRSDCTCTRHRGCVYCMDIHSSTTMGVCQKSRGEQHEALMQANTDIPDISTFIELLF